MVVIPEEHHCHQGFLLSEKLLGTYRVGWWFLGGFIGVVVYDFSLALPLFDSTYNSFYFMFIFLPTLSKRHFRNHALFFFR